MKCEICDSEIDASGKYCSNCGNIMQMSVEIQVERAKKIRLNCLLIGLLIIVIGLVGFWWLMDIYSNTLYESVEGGYSFSDGIDSKKDAWHFLLFINYPMFLLTLFMALGFSVLVDGLVIQYLFNRK